jgi:hypothetical protein
MTECSPPGRSARHPEPQRAEEQSDDGGAADVIVTRPINDRDADRFSTLANASTRSKRSGRSIGNAISATSYQ